MRNENTSIKMISGSNNKLRMFHWLVEFQHLTNIFEYCRPVQALENETPPPHPMPYWKWGGGALTWRAFGHCDRRWCSRERTVQTSEISPPSPCGENWTVDLLPCQTRPRAQGCTAPRRCSSAAGRCHPPMPALTVFSSFLSFFFASTNFIHHYFIKITKTKAYSNF